MTVFDTLGDLISAAAARQAGGIAVVGPDDRRLSWGELDARSNRAARALRSLGLERGARVVTVIGERIEYAEVYATLAKAGLIAVPVSWRFKSREMLGIVEDAQPDAIIYEDELAGTIGPVIDSHPVSVLVQIGGTRSLPGAHVWGALADEGSAAPVNDAAGADIAILGYTSGTTGTPKGATFDHCTCRTAATAAVLCYDLPPGGVGVLTGSLSYATVTIAHLWAHVVSGGTSVISGRFDVGNVLELLERHSATFTYLPTPVIGQATDLLADRPNAMARLRTLLVGASPISPHVLERLVEVAGCRVNQSYGMTEHAGVPVCVGKQADWESDPEPYTSIGRALFPSVLALADERETLPHDGETVGELLLRSPLVMREYWNRPDATRDAIRDGWFHTGDQASISSDGRVMLKGRSKEVIISGGTNIYPVEVEIVMSESPRVRACAVVGAPDTRWGETPIAFVEVTGAADGIEQHLRELCRAMLANYKCPTRVLVVDELPRNANGKVLKSELAELASATTADQFRD